MAFDDSLIGSNDFDPRAATEDLIRQQHDEPLPSMLDPRMLNTRLARKLGQKPPKAPEPKPENLDFSGFEQEAPGPVEPSGNSATSTKPLQDTNLDFSSFAPAAPDPDKPAPAAGLTTYAKEFGKGAVEGFKNMGASSLKGIATVVPEAGAQPDYDPMGNPLGTNNAMETGAQPVPMQQRQFYKAGEAVEHFGKDALAPAPGFEPGKSWTRDIGSGAGSMLAGIPVSMIPGVGPIAAATLYTTSGMGEAVDNAVKGKASESQIETAGLMGAVAGATDMVDTMLPFLGGSTGRALGFIKRVGWAAVKSAMMEGGQEGVQQLMQNAIAKGLYKPDQDIFEDVPRSIAIAAILGGIVGGGGAALHKDQAPAAPSGPTSGTPGAPGGAPPGGGASSGGPGAGGGPRSSPEDIADFVQQAQAGNSTQTGTQSARPRDPATMDDAELTEAFTQARDSMGGKSLDEILRAGGYAPDTIKQMPERGKVEEAIGIARAYANEAPQQTGPEAAPESSGPAEPPAAGAKGPDQPSHHEYAILREYGYSDEDIANMPQRQRFREVIDAQAEGIDAKAAMAKHPLPAQTVQPTGQTPDRAGAAGTRQDNQEDNRQGTRESPIKATTQEDVRKAQPVEPKSPAQAEAENYQHAHLELPQFGLTGNKSISIETGVGQTRNGPPGPDGKPQWSVKMTHGAYGRMKGTLGADGQPLDVMVGAHPTSPHVFVIDQHHPPSSGKSGFDEHKTMLGYLTPIDAMHAYAHSYDDAGKDRIGGVTAMDAAQFEAWRNGDTTKPLMQGQRVTPAPSVAAEEAGVDRPLTEASGEGTNPEVPKAGAVEGGGTANAGTETSEKDAGSYEVTENHHQAIEDALGPLADDVVPADIARAAEILAENEGMPPETAFGQAVAETAVEQGFITEQEAEQAYGPEVKDILSDEEGGGPKAGVQAGLQRVSNDDREVRGSSQQQLSMVRGQGRDGSSDLQGEEGLSQLHGGDRTSPDAVAHDQSEDQQQGVRAGQSGLGNEKGTIGQSIERPKTDSNGANQDTGRLGQTSGDRFETTIPSSQNGLASGTDSRSGQKIDDEQNKTLLEPVGEGPSGGSSDLEPERPASGEVAAGGTEEAGVVPGGGEAGETKGPREPGGRQDGEQHDTTGQEPNTGRKAGDKPAKGGTKAAVETDVTADDDGGVEQPKIEDAGAKIGDARKDAWGGRGLSFADLEGMTDIERDKNLTKHNIWERPDYVQAVADGMDPVAAALVKRIYDRFPVKPKRDRYDGDDAVKAFIKGLNVVKDIAKEVKTVEDAKGIDRAATMKLSYAERSTLYPAKSLQNPLAIDGADERAAKRAVDAGFPELAPWTRLFLVRHQSFGKPTWNLYRKNGGLISEHDTKEAAETAAKEAYAKLSDERKQGAEEPKRPHLDHIFREGPDYRKDRNVTGEDFIKDFGFHGVEFGNWVAGDERQKTVNFAYDALHDLAHALGVAPKALSLGGRLSVGFGSRGRGGKAAAHYEAGRTVINMTKLSGAGALAHEYGHALDHYLGDLNNGAAVKGARSISGWDDTRPVGHYRQNDFVGINRHLPMRLRAAVNRLMHDLFSVEEDDAAASQRLQRELESAKSSQQSWIDHLKRLRERKAKGESAQGMKQAETQIEVWGRTIARRERDLATVQKKLTSSNYLTEATKLSGTTGDYWRRPNEMFARAFEAFVHDKIKDEGFESQYLVQGVEPNRFGNGFKGNPYPAGDERATINADFERLLRGIEVVEDRIQGAQGEPEPVQKVEKVEKPTPQPSAKDEAAAVEANQHKTLDAAFQAHFTAGEGFSGIVEARKFAKDRGFSDDQKAIEEALEFGIVKTARFLVEADAEPAHTYSALVKLYGRQPRLGTRTSTSVRDQAYSTPVPLAYLAGRLADINHDTSVYEPTAGNGALLITADPGLSTANELNPARVKNLTEQGFGVNTHDAATFTPSFKVDRVIANPPFGPLKDAQGASTVFDLRKETGVSYQTHEIDHAIAFKALAVMNDNGRAVLLLGGVNKLVSTQSGRADAYNGKSKREFFKALYDNYNVTDIFTVSGDLYERQGAGWPVDVVVINGRGKSSLSLPAVTPPRIYKTWDELGGLLNGQQATGGVQPASIEAGGASETGPGLESTGAGDSGRAGGDLSGLGQPGGVHGQREPRAPESGTRGGVTGNGTEGPRQGVEPAGPREQSSAVDDFDSAFDNALDAAYGTEEKPKPAGPVKPRGERSTAEVAKDTAKSGIDAADEAFTALHKLFGGNKLSMGVSFDEDTYKAAKPHFEAAANKFSEFKNNLGELLNRMIAHLRDAMQFTRAAMERIRPYLKRFIDDMRAAPEERKSAIRPEATETENQVVYKPQSKVGGLNTLAPVNMAKPMADSLARLEAKVGQIDTFVMNELGYTPAQLEKNFGAEQVDALGLAIDAIKEGKGFIIGDQTGIGKGRVNAAIIRWAIKNDRMPVFITEKPNLYRDMFRDLMDIGITDGFLDNKPRILATNAALTLPLEEGNGARIKTADAKDHNKHMMAVLGDVSKHYDMVFSTYNQMQTQKGEDTARRQFLLALTNRPGGIVIVIDEAHNAGGQKGARKAKDEAAGRSDFARDMIQKANGVFYSSATYAKRPEVMDLYSATDMAMAVDNIEDLAEAIQRGGIPMQQAVASMLAKAGQYVRRERSFAGINYNTPLIPVDRKTYDGISHALAAIQDLSKHTAGAATRITTELRAEGGAIGADSATGDTGASSTNFTAVMHNVINQMLLAMKSEQAADRAIASIKAGEKPVLTVANTMEAFLKDYADNLNLAPGDEVAGDFGHVLKKYLDRTRTVLIKKAHREKGEKPIRHYLTASELGPAGVAVYARAEAQIAGLDLSGLPISPIDYIKGRIIKAGYSIGEVTGRTLSVDYTGKVPVMSSRPGAEKTPAGRTKTIEQFNTRPKKGGVHALIINQAGSTGLSAHAGEKFDDQSKRRMMVVQPEANIDTHMQLLGRINRTGQVVLPEYDQLVADIPAEKRPAAVLSKKMASLNANTTASRSSAVTAKDVPDFINQYGDEIAASFVRDNLETNFRLASPFKMSEEGKIDAADAMRRLTGRLPLLPLEEQEAIYQQLESEYAALIAQLEASGENALEARSLDLKARLTEWQEVQSKRNGSGSPFAAPVILQKVSIARLGKPFTAAEIMSRLSETMGDAPLSENAKQAQDIGTLANMLKGFNDQYNGLGKRVREREMQERRDQVKLFDAYTRPIIDEEQNPEQRAKDMVKFNEIKDRWSTIHQMVPIGRRVVLKTDTNNLTAVVLDVKQQGHTKNPLALGSWKVTFAIADASRQMTIPFSRLYENGKSNPDSALDVEVEPMTEWYERYENTLDKYQHMQNEAREERYIAGGNILAAYDWLDRKGSIINYTSYKGTVHQGVLTARGFDPKKQSLLHGKIERDPVALKQILDTTLDRLWAKDGNVALQKDGRYGTDYVVSAQKAKNKGGVYYLDRELTNLTGDFVSKGGNMVAYLSPANFAKAVTRMQKLGAEFKTAAADAVVNKVGEKKDQSGGGEEEQGLAAIHRAYDLKLPAPQVNRIKSLVAQSVEKMVGRHVGVVFTDGAFEMPGQKSQDMWGGAEGKAAAAYFPGRALVMFALDSNLETNIPHEMYHVVEFQLQTPEERALMERETPRIREGIRGYAKEKYKLDDAIIDRLAGEEVRAIGMEAFMEGKLGGAHVGVRRWYQKLWDMLRNLATKLRGMGIEKAEDIYSRVQEGYYRNAPGATPRPEASSPGLAAIRPGGTRPGPQPRSETIAEQLRDRNHDRLAGLSQKLGIGKINTTELRTKVQDKFIRVRHAETSVGNTQSALSAYQAESLYYGRTGERLETLEKTKFDPLIKQMHGRDISPGELNEYLYAMHAPERNAYIDTINPNLVGEGSGMSDTDAANVINAITAAGKLADFQALDRMVRQIIDETRDTMVAYGLISQDTADAWAQQYQHYVPLRGFAEGSEDEGMIGRGRGYDIRGKEVKAAFGRKSEADGPLQYIMMQAESAIVRGEKNRVGNTFLRFVRANPDPDRWQVNAPTLKRRIDARTGLVTYYADFNVHNEPDAFVTKVGGKPMVIRLYGKDGLNIARALKQMGTSNMNSIVRVIHTMTTTMSRLSTQWNPNFTLPNLARDLGEALINLQAQDQQRFVKNFAGHLMPAMKGAFKALAGVGGRDRYVDAFHEFDRAGGRIRFFGLDDPDDIKRNIDRKMRKLEGGALNNALGAGAAVGHGFEIVNGAVENATRLAAYMAARDVGMSAPDSAMLARNLTVDFNKKGEWGPAINAAYMFANASIQGGARLGRAMTHKRVRRAAYALAAMGALGALYNILAGGDDDDGTPYYSKIKPYIRDKNIIIMWPKGFGHDGKYVKIPLPYGFSPFHVIGDRAAGVALGKDKASQAASSVLTSTADAFNPLGEESSPWMMMVPSLIRPGLHIAVNRNWTGNPLYPEHDYDKTRPDSQKSFQSNSAFSKAAAEKLNAATGGSPYKAGWLDVHPGSIDHVLETITGGLGKFVMDVVKTGGALINGEPFDETRAPVIRRFLGTTKDPQTDAAAYYEARDEARKAGGENLKAAKKDMRAGNKNREEAESFVNESRAAPSGDTIFKHADAQMKPLRAQKARIEASTEMSDEQKRRETDAVVERMRQIQNAARKRYREMREGAQ